MILVYPTKIESLRAVRPSSGISDDAVNWDIQENKLRENMSRATSLNVAEMKDDLLELFKEHSQDNWDGYGAKAVTLENLSAAFEFLGLFPTTFPRPELGTDPDGGIVFEWYRGPRRVFSVAVEKDNQLTYAGLFNSSKVSGTEYFDDDLPQAIYLHIQRVLSYNARI